jgi:inosine/xanthosine triphosphatase
MKKVVVGSQNPVKLQAAKKAFELVFPNEAFVFETCSAESSVADQPMGMHETKLGAANRAAHAAALVPDADYTVGLEGGIEELEEDYWVTAWMCVRRSDGMTGFGRTSAFMLPEMVTNLVKEGKELGFAIDEHFNETNLKQRGGAVGILTNNLITRADFYHDAMVFALVPFMNPELY